MIYSEFLLQKRQSWVYELAWWGLRVFWSENAVVSNCCNMVIFLWRRWAFGHSFKKFRTNILKSGLNKYPMKQFSIGYLYLYLQEVVVILNGSLTGQWTRKLKKGATSISKAILYKVASPDKVLCKQSRSSSKKEGLVFSTMHV